MGTTPSFEDIPIDLGDFPPYIQYIFSSIYSMLPDRWEGMSGTYMGKDYGILPFLLEINGIEDNKKELFQFLLLIDNAAKKFYYKKQKTKQASTSKPAKPFNKRG